MNQLRAWMLMGVLTILLVLLGRAFGGPSGAVTFFLIALAMNAIGYFFSDKIALKMSGAQPIDEAEAPELYAMVRRLVARANLPMPALYVIPSMQPNAFATGRNPKHSAVAVTQGLMHLMSREELEGVIAHELAHIKNRDVLVMSLAATLAGAITMLADMVRWGMIFGFGGQRDEEDAGPGHLVAAMVMAIVAPLAATLIQLAISRSREFHADATGARIAGSPHGLANALLRLDQASRMVHMPASPATAHLYIVNPLSGSSFLKLFSTHPPIHERVERLRQMRVA